MYKVVGIIKTEDGDFEQPFAEYPTSLEAHAFIAGYEYHQKRVPFMEYGNAESLFVNKEKGFNVGDYVCVKKDFVRVYSLHLLAFAPIGTIRRIVGGVERDVLIEIPFPTGNIDAPHPLFQWVSAEHIELNVEESVPVKLSEGPLPPLLTANQNRGLEMLKNVGKVAQSPHGLGVIASIDANERTYAVRIGEDTYYGIPDCDVEII